MAATTHATENDRRTGQPAREASASPRAGHAPTAVPEGPGPAAGGSAVAAGTAVAEPTSIPHDCDLAEPTGSHEKGNGREVGIDVARGLALIGMMVVHLLPAVTADGGITTPWLLSVGKASALFAVVAGVGIALTTGRTRRLSGRRWAAATSALLVRALLIATIGLALGMVVDSSSAFVILPYYGLLFVLAIPFLRLPVGWLIALAAVVGLGMPVLSHVARAGFADPGPVNLTFAMVAQDPGFAMTELLFAGTYPVLAWMTYILVGLAVGRSHLSHRGVDALITVIGIGVALFARFASWYLLSEMGGLQTLSATAIRTMSLQEFTEIAIWGSSGTLPADSPWWLAVLAPHAATPPDLFFTAGIALAVLGVCLMLGRVIGPLLYPLAAAGSMPLTLYVTHLLLIAAPFMPERGGLSFGLQVVLLITFAVTWRHWFARGPLEELLYRVTNAVRLRVMGSRTAESGTRHAAAA